MEIASTRRRLPAISALLAIALVAPEAGCRRKPGPSRTRDAGAPPTAVLEGRVVDKADHPVPEARVLAFAAAGDAPPAETATDPQGGFRLDRLRPGGYR